MHRCISQIKHQLDATLCRFYFCRVTLHVWHPKHVEWLCRNKTCTVLHQVGFFIWKIISGVKIPKFGKNLQFLNTVCSLSLWPRCLVRGSAGPLACWDCGFKSHRGYGWLSVVSVVCCQVEVSGTGRSLNQRRYTKCVCVWVWFRNFQSIGRPRVKVVVVPE